MEWGLRRSRKWDPDNQWRNETWIEGTFSFGDRKRGRKDGCCLSLCFLNSGASAHPPKGKERGVFAHQWEFSGSWTLMGSGQGINLICYEEAGRFGSRRWRGLQFACFYVCWIALWSRRPDYLPMMKRKWDLRLREIGQVWNPNSGQKWWETEA